MVTGAPPGHLAVYPGIETWRLRRCSRGGCCWFFVWVFFFPPLDTEQERETPRKMLPSWSHVGLVSGSHRTPRQREKKKKKKSGRWRGPWWGDARGDFMSWLSRTNVLANK